MKRHGFGGTPASHGHSVTHRHPGSIGCSSFPGRVMKGRRMAGHMGSERVTTKNLKVFGIDEENNLILIEGPCLLYTSGLGELLQPGSPATEIIIEDEEGPVRVTIGDANFRRSMEGLEIIEDFVSPESGETLVAAGTRLASADLAAIVGCPPKPLFIRDMNLLEGNKEKSWFAADVEDDGSVIIKMDSLLDDEAIALLKSHNTRQIKLWKAPEVINLTDAMHHVLIEHFFGKAITQALNADGEVIEDIPHVIDGSVVRGLVEGAISGVECDDMILTKERIVKLLLTERALGKILLEPCLLYTSRCV